VRGAYWLHGTEPRMRAGLEDLNTSIRTHAPSLNAEDSLIAVMTTWDATDTLCSYAGTRKADRSWLGEIAR
jgi:hypothetical protein